MQDNSFPNFIGGRDRKSNSRKRVYFYSFCNSSCMGGFGGYRKPIKQFARTKRLPCAKGAPAQRVRDCLCELPIYNSCKTIERQSLRVLLRKTHLPLHKGGFWGAGICTRGAFYICTIATSVRRLLRGSSWEAYFIFCLLQKATGCAGGF